MIKLMSEEYKLFLKLISTLKINCDNVNIENGFIRQRDNSRRCIYEIDLTKLINNVSLSITSLKNKLDILSTFDKNDIEINVNNDMLSFSDDCSIIKFRNSSIIYMNNSFINIEEFNNIVLLNPEDEILSFNIDKTMSDKIKKISKSFKNENIQIKFNDDKASILALTDSKNQEITFIKNIEVIKNINGYTNIIVDPFIFDHDDLINLKIYLLDNDVCISKFETKFLDFNVNILTQSQLLNND